MKINSIFVNELPTSCSDCQLLTKWSTDGKRMYCFCVVRDEMVNLIDYPNSRPNNCPLKLEDKTDKFKIKLLEANLAEAMAAINDTCDHCGWKEFCEYSECRFFEFRKNRKDNHENS